MMNSLFNEGTMPLLEQLAVFGEKRQEVLAGNIANIDTPRYKNRDLPVEDFRNALKEAVSRRQNATASRSISQRPARTVQEMFPRELFLASESPPQNITFQDGNNRSIEHQMMKMTKNTMMQNFAIELMRSQMAMLQMAISEQF